MGRNNVMVIIVEFAFWVLAIRYCDLYDLMAAENKGTVILHWLLTKAIT